MNSLNCDHLSLQPPRCRKPASPGTSSSKQKPIPVSSPQPTQISLPSRTKFMAEEIQIAAPRPGLIVLSASAVCIGAAGLLLLVSSPEGLESASIAYLSASLLAFMVGIFVMLVAVSGVPLRPIRTELLTKLLVAASIAALMLAPPPGRLQGAPKSPGLPLLAIRNL